ncbi:thiamine phosphate synthase [Pedobacter psychrophilus]|uniref:Thiamine-phosphate synthase n=1 Tax=Pedobacter psychrophilus TaxID=1826909 RepID=A0A179DEF8_9SPHI|nr:thiamine phosphate synthase [Pedobacter psychrophilus]OAQ39202.1 thiamine phosphate synthase [Pedobacter psychrophilus]
MKKYISKLHFLTQDLPNRTHLEQAQLACEAGANWIQYRCMSKSDEEMLAELHPIASVCDDWGATLIITNHVHLVALADIQGVHIEGMDEDLTLIRNQIGEDKTLGASANDFNQIKRHIDNGADYVGCGPFGHTDTKPNDYAHLGLSGYEKIVGELVKSGLNIPLIAVGGIESKNVTSLLATGIYGIAVSGAINNSEDPKQMYKQFHQLIF